MKLRFDNSRLRFLIHESNDLNSKTAHAKNDSVPGQFDSPESVVGDWEGTQFWSYFRVDGDLIATTRLASIRPGHRIDGIDPVRSRLTLIEGVALYCGESFIQAFQKAMLVRLDVRCNAVTREGRVGVRAIAKCHDVETFKVLDRRN